MADNIYHRAEADSYLATNTARLIDPELGKIYYEQMVVHGNPHTKAVCRVARALIPRILSVMKEDRDYVICDLEGNPISKEEGPKIVKERFFVAQEVRQRLSNRRRVPPKVDKPNFCHMLTIPRPN